MIKYFKLYLVSLATFFAIDMIWLGLVVRSFYQQSLGFLIFEGVGTHTGLEVMGDLPRLMQG